MKLGVFAAVFGDRSFEEALDSVQALGFEAIEIGAGNFAGTKDCDPNALLNDEKKLKEFVKKVESRGLLISALNCSGNPLHPNISYAKQNQDDLVRAVELAGKIGVKVVNTFGGCPGGDENSLFPIGLLVPGLRIMKKR